MCVCEINTKKKKKEMRKYNTILIKTFLLLYRIKIKHLNK